MKREYLEFRKCFHTQDGFKSGKEYLTLGKDDQYTYTDLNNQKRPCYRAVNDKGTVTIVIPCNVFHSNSRVVQSIKDVVYVGIEGNEGLEEGEAYSVFNAYEEDGETKYTIFDGVSRFVKLPASLFLPEKHFLEMSKEEYEIFKEDKKETLIKLIETAKEREEQAIKDRLERERLEGLKNIELNTIKEFTKLIKASPKEDLKGLFVDETSQLLQKITSISNKAILGCVLVIIISLFQKSLIATGINLILVILGLRISSLARERALKNLDQYAEKSDKPDEGYVELMNSFDDGILLKLKKIEVSLLLLENSEVIHKETLALIKDSVTLCLESYKVKDETLLKDIDNFLDKTIEYIETLIDSDNSEQLYIQKQIYESVSAIINKNSQIFELMTSGNKNIKKILNR